MLIKPCVPGTTHTHTHTHAHIHIYVLNAVVQSLSHAPLFGTPWTAAHLPFLSFTISQSLLKLISTKSVVPSKHLILCRPLLLPSIFPSIGVFSKESALHITWPKYWSFSFTISPSSEYSGLTSFRMDWLDLLAVQGTLKCLLQHHNSKASILQYSASFMVQLSHPCVYAHICTQFVYMLYILIRSSLKISVLNTFILHFTDEES